MEVEVSTCRKLAEILSGLEIEEEKFVDPRFFPSPGDDPEHVARYFFFMVAIDHRTRTRRHSYGETVEGEYLEGSELLYRLGAKRYEEGVEMFSPEKMARISASEVKEWLSYGSAEIRDPDVRAYLLRDCALKLLALYKGSVLRLLGESTGVLYAGIGGGLIERLKVFRAYEDPVEKKSFLLVKFLARRGLFEPRDREKLQVAVDNHLTRVAVRTGMLVAEGRELELFARARRASYEEDVVVRMYARIAYKIVARESGLDPLLLDDVVWSIGRGCCKEEGAECDTGRVAALRARGCPLRTACRAYSEPRLKKLVEHELETWYY